MPPKKKQPVVPRRAKLQILPCEGSKTGKDPHYVRLLAANHDVLGQSKNYTTRASAQRAARAWLVAAHDVLAQLAEEREAKRDVQAG